MYAAEGVVLTFQLISQMTKFGVLKPTCSEAANAIGPGVSNNA